MSDERHECHMCNGSGHYRSYGEAGRCPECLGTGKDLTLADRELFGMIATYLENREEYGRRS